MPFPPSEPPPESEMFPGPDFLAGWDGPEPEEPTDAELLGLWPDPLAGPPDGEDAWLADLSAAELDALAANWGGEKSAAGTGPEPAVIVCGLPSGFEAGGVLDSMEPGSALAGFAGGVFEKGLGALSDDELTGMLCASRRVSAWQAGLEFAAIAELDARRLASGRADSSASFDRVSAELSATLRMTARSADALLDLARGVARLPGVRAALLTGRIDRTRAAVFVSELSALDSIKASAVAAAFANLAGQMTTGQLRGAIRAMVLALFPDSIRQRAERARRYARVETWPESSGNAGLAGRELPQAEAIAADKRITAMASALKKAGAPGSLDALRATVFTALLTGRDPSTLLPERAGDNLRPGPDLAAMTGSVHLTMPLSTWLGWSKAPGEAAGFGPLDADTCRDIAARIAAGPGARWCVTLTDAAGRAAAHACGRSTPRSGRPGPMPGTSAPEPASRTSPPRHPVPDPGPPGTAVPGHSPPPPGTGHSPPANDPPGTSGPGHSPANGPPAPGHSPPATGPPGTPIPGPPGTPAPAPRTSPPRHPAPDPGSPGRFAISPGMLDRCPASTHSWLSSLSFDWLERGTCQHERETGSYRPGNRLRHLVAIRHRTCGYPTCRRPAELCDLDHTVPFDSGGRTCECDLAPLCRSHHQVKQAPGWHLAQPEPGILTWTTPSGRSCTAGPDRYPL